MLKDAQSPLWDGCDKYSVLSASLRALTLKTDYGLSEGCFNEWMQFMGDIMPDDNRFPKNIYQAKKTVAELGLGSMKIDCCPSGCMLYYKENEMLQNCKVCQRQRYKRFTRRGKDKVVPLKSMWYFPLVPRLKRLYSSMQTAHEMKWHHTHQREPSSLSHPSDAEAWRHFDETWPDFAQEPRNVRLGLCADGFAPFDKTGRTYSCWPVIVTPYNLPSWLCMRREFMFLTIIIPGPSNPKNKVDVYLRPLIDELKMLWDDGVMTYDVSLKQNFLMRAALMWTINDFPAYGMLSGWMTMGRLACPICMENNRGFSLACSKKTSWFDCHRRFLPQDHPYRRNKTSFTKGKVEVLTPPRRLSGQEIWERVQHLPSIEESQEQNPSGYGKGHNWTK
uniref:Transposase n=2 Tax=Cajanus cajan TaxID=3821 RepID=A0A151UIM5_CAJCA